ncbi:MAG: cell division protein FtsL [Rhodocyclaceae bacterium]|nr:cell division protein FtsL [Rhodocyclaceae bacterium]
MVRIHILLALLCVACALGVVASQHKARKLYAELEREQEHMRQLEIEWGQLQIEQSTLAAHGRVEVMARGDLQMVTPVPGMVLSLEPRASGAQP